MPLTVNNIKITPKLSVKYLGVHLDAYLNFKKHVAETMRKVYAVNKSLFSLTNNYIRGSRLEHTFQRNHATAAEVAKQSSTEHY